MARPASNGCVRLCEYLVQHQLRKLFCLRMATGLLSFAASVAASTIKRMACRTRLDRLGQASMTFFKSLLATYGQHGEGSEVSTRCPVLSSVCPLQVHLSQWFAPKCPRFVPAVSMVCSGPLASSNPVAPTIFLLAIRSVAEGIPTLPFPSPRVPIPPAYQHQGICMPASTLRPENRAKFSRGSGHAEDQRVETGGLLTVQHLPHLVGQVFS